MSNIVLVMGNSGSGKTTSIRNLDPKETYIISIIPKDLPFKGGRTKYFLSRKEGDKIIQGNRKIIFNKSFSTFDYSKDKNIFAGSIELICNTLKNISDKLPNVKNIIIDDSQYIMAYEFIARAKEKGFDKYNELAQNFFDVISTAQSLRDDITVFFLHHIEMSDGLRKAKTLGRLLDNALTIEGLFTVVLLADVRRNDGKSEYFFITNSDGTSTAKSPEGMFPSEIPNDLKIVLEYMNKYYQGE